MRRASGRDTMRAVSTVAAREEASVPCPFPGMDPYLERREIWADFHDRLVALICAALQPHLRPRYVALTQDRIYVVESERGVRPDVSVVRTSASKSSPQARRGVLELDTPVVFDLVREEIREPLIHIVETAAGNRLVTALEVLSPSNKGSLDGRSAYLQKTEELWDGGASLVEIDLWPGGDPIVRVPRERLESLRPWRYVVAVSRYEPPKQEVYRTTLDQRLPRVGVPLAKGDSDVPLDLQAVFARCWEEGPYPELLRYDGPPPGGMTAEEARWVEGTLRTAGIRA